MDAVTPAPEAAGDRTSVVAAIQRVIQARHDRRRLREEIEDRETDDFLTAMGITRHEANEQ